MAVRLLLAAFLLVGTAPQAPPVEIPGEVRSAADRITAAALQRDLEYLASDRLQGRNTASPGFDMAADQRQKHDGLDGTTIR